MSAATPQTNGSPGWERAGPAKLPTQFGDFGVYAYTNPSGAHHAVVFRGDITSARDPLLVRVHSSCVTGDIFRSLKCDCGVQLHAAMNLIALEGEGLVVYLDQEGRGIGLTNKIRAYVLQDGGLDTVEANEALGFAADERHYGEAAHILHDLGATEVRLLTNNPRKAEGLSHLGISVVERVPLVVESNPHNTDYLATKGDKLGHQLPSRDAGGLETA